MTIAAEPTERPADLSNSLAENICRTCGACCGFFAQAGKFYIGVFKSDDNFDALRDELEILDEDFDLFWKMKIKTDCQGDKCGALEGVIGEKVGCRLYDIRPRDCAAFSLGSPNCRRARSYYKLPALDDALLRSVEIEKPVQIQPLKR